MKKGYLSQYFKGVASKKLSSVEASKEVSNQHEFNGAKNLIKLLGVPDSKRRIETTFLYLNDSEHKLSSEGTLTWYDAREKHPSRSELRLYYSTNVVTESMKTGDTLFICLKSDDSALVIIAESFSTIESQLLWLFNITSVNIGNFQIVDDLSNTESSIYYASKIILDELGIDAFERSDDFLEDMIRNFNNAFPSTKEFSEYARSTVDFCSPIEEPDETLMTWIDREESLFRTFEKYLIADRIKSGFFVNDSVNVDEFVSYSLSVLNRRKSRVGRALENHFEEILKLNEVSYSRTEITENSSKPDFLFPGITYYKDHNFPVELLTMLGAKTTCKDRWRQILDEADRIERKHLLTLEAAISVQQLKNMCERKIQLVVPKMILSSYSQDYSLKIMSVEVFLTEVKNKQRRSVEVAKR